MVRLRRAAKFPLHISTHDLRHFCGSHWMRLGVPHADITKMLGHANVKITMTLYAHSDNQHLDRAKKII
jgi:integrase